MRPTSLMSTAIKEDNSTELLEDVETVIEDSDPLTYYDSTGASQTTVQTTIATVDTDEGVLEPLGVGEITLEIRY